MDLELARVERAANTIDPVFVNSPQFSDGQLGMALGRDVVVKLETANPLRSFKGRGTDFLAGELAPGSRVVCASSGNFGQAMAYACTRRGIGVEVFAPAGLNPAKRERMTAFGAVVTEVDASGRTPKQRARDHADRNPDRVLVADGQHPAIAEGAGTIGVELLRVGSLDAVVVPVGDGALISGIGCWIKQHSPSTRIIGVCSTRAPALVHSWRAGEPVAAEATTVADGISISDPFPESVRRMREVVDDMVMVEDSALFDAMRLAARTLGVVLEPAGAAGIAAIATHDLPGDRIATVLTGGNIRPRHLSDVFLA